MAERPGSLLDAVLRRHEDPSQAKDPRVRDLVRDLAALPTPDPGPQFRAELRTQLVAIAPRLVVASSPEIAARPRPGPRPAPRPVLRPVSRAVGQAVPRSIATATAIAASVLVIAVMVLGGGVWLSRSALPGDSLYGIKLAAEQLRLDMATSDGARAADYLSFATTRAEEARQLLGRSGAAGAVDPTTVGRIESALRAANEDEEHGSALLSAQAVQQRSGIALNPLTAWAPDQLALLRQIAAAAPPGPLRSAANGSAQLVAGALAQARALLAKAGCGCRPTTHPNQLGPPCIACTSHRAGISSSARSATAPSTLPSGAGSGVHHVAHPGLPTRSGSGTGAGAPLPLPTPGPSLGNVTGTGGVPGLPLPTSAHPSANKSAHKGAKHSTPVDVGSCGVSVSVGGIGIGVGSCTSQP